MADAIHDPQVSSAQLSAEELRDHQETFHSFNKLILFAVLHIGLVLACMALAFLGHVPVLALLLGLGGTVALIGGFVVAG